MVSAILASLVALAHADDLALTSQSAMPRRRKVKATVIVSRHGVRTPYAPIDDGKFCGNLTTEAIARVTDRPFPAVWPPGPTTSDIWGTSGTAQLTPHGSQSIVRLGAWHGRKDFPHVHCDDVALYADTDSKRDNDTAVAWAKGAFPKCSSIHTENAIRDPLGDVALFNQGGDTSLCDFPGRQVIDSFLGGSDASVVT